MALRAKDVPVTREMVLGWLEELAEKNRGAGAAQTKPQNFLRAKLAKLDLDETMVDTSGHESLEDETSLLAMILQDLPSYGL